MIYTLPPDVLIAIACAIVRTSTPVFFNPLISVSSISFFSNLIQGFRYLQFKLDGLLRLEVRHLKRNTVTLIN